MNCVHHPASDAPYQCSYCRAPICVDCERKVDGRSVCLSCLKLQEERVAARYLDETRNISHAGAVISGLLAALIFALLWSQLAVSSGLGLSVGAVTMGGIVGYAVITGAGRKRGRTLQQIGAILTIVGILCAHFLILMRAQAHSDYRVPDFGSETLSAAYSFPSYLSSLSPWNGLFLVLGVIWGYWAPHVHVAGNRASGPGPV